MTHDDVNRWLHGYVDAWMTYEPDAIGALFSERRPVPLPPLGRADRGPRRDRGRLARRPRRAGHLRGRVRRRLGGRGRRGSWRPAPAATTRPPASGRITTCSCSSSTPTAGAAPFTEVLLAGALTRFRAGASLAVSLPASRRAARGHPNAQPSAARISRRASMPRNVRGALLQATWTGDKESMIQKHEGYAHEAAKQGAQVMLFQELFYGPYFCQVQDQQYYSYTELIPDGPTTKRMQDLAKQTGMVLVVPMYEEDEQGLGHLLQHRGGHRRRRQVPRQVPQDAHPARPGLLGEVLLPPRQHGLPGVRDGRRQGRRLHLLRPALPGGRPRARPQRRGDGVHPVRHEPRPVRVPLARRAGQPCAGQRLLRRDDQPGRHRVRHRSPTTSTARATSSTRAASSSARSAARTTRSC